jgi:hypothetical protein
VSSPVQRSLRWQPNEAKLINRILIFKSSKRFGADGRKQALLRALSEIFFEGSTMTVGGRRRWGWPGVDIERLAELIADARGLEQCRAR